MPDSIVYALSSCYILYSLNILDHDHLRLRDWPSRHVVIIVDTVQIGPRIAASSLLFLLAVFRFILVSASARSSASAPFSVSASSFSSSPTAFALFSLNFALP